MKYNTYSDKLKHPLWQKKRLEIMKRDGFECKKCDDHESPLHVHHIEYINGNDPWDYPNKLLITLCEDCHEVVEWIKKDNPEIKLSQISIYKLDKWNTGHKIIFISHGSILTMRIYNPDGERIVGFNFCASNLGPLSQLVKKTLRQFSVEIKEILSSKAPFS